MFRAYVEVEVPLDEDIAQIIKAQGKEANNSVESEEDVARIAIKNIQHHCKVNVVDSIWEGMICYRSRYENLKENYEDLLATFLASIKSNEELQKNMKNCYDLLCTIGSLI